MQNLCSSTGGGRAPQIVHADKVGYFDVGKGYLEGVEDICKRKFTNSVTQEYRSTCNSNYMLNNSAKDIEDWAPHDWTPHDYESLVGSGYGLSLGIQPQIFSSFYTPLKTSWSDSNTYFEGEVVYDEATKHSFDIKEVLSNKDTRGYTRLQNNFNKFYFNKNFVMGSSTVTVTVEGTGCSVSPSTQTVKNGSTATFDVIGTGRSGTPHGCEVTEPIGKTFTTGVIRENCEIRFYCD